MIAQQDQRQLIQRAPGRGKLLQNVDTVRVSGQHPANPAKLALRAREARREIALHRGGSRRSLLSMSGVILVRHCIPRGSIVATTDTSRNPDKCERKFAMRSWPDAR